MKKFLILLILLFSVSFIFNLNVSAEPGNATVIDINKVKVEINGQKTSMGSLFFEEVTYVPLRTISEYFGKGVSWDDKTNTARINDVTKPSLTVNSETKEKADLGKTVSSLISTALILSGAVLLSQIIFLRSKKDLSIILKAFSSSNVSNLGLRRLIYTGWVSKIGFGYLVCGFILRLYGTGASIHIAMNILINIILILIFWLLGLWISKIISNKQYIQEFDTYEHTDGTSENGSYGLF